MTVETLVALVFATAGGFGVGLTVAALIAGASVPVVLPFVIAAVVSFVAVWAIHAMSPSEDHR